MTSSKSETDQTPACHIQNQQTGHADKLIMQRIDIAWCNWLKSPVNISDRLVACIKHQYDFNNEHALKKYWCWMYTYLYSNQGLWRWVSAGCLEIYFDGLYWKEMPSRSQTDALPHAAVYSSSIDHDLSLMRVHVVYPCIIGHQWYEIFCDDQVSVCYHKQSPPSILQDSSEKENMAYNFSSITLQCSSGVHCQIMAYITRNLYLYPTEARILCSRVHTLLGNLLPYAKPPL